MENTIENKNRKRDFIISLGLLACLFLVLVILENVLPRTSILFTVLKKGAIYALVAVSMNLLNGFTGLFSLGQAGFMLLGAYTYAIFTIPSASRDTVYQYFDAAIRFSFPEVFSKSLGGFGTVLGIIVAVIIAGLLAAFFAFLSHGPLILCMKNTSK